MRNILTKVANVFTGVGISALGAAILVVPNSSSRVFGAAPAAARCTGGNLWCDAGCTGRFPKCKGSGGCNVNTNKCFMCGCLSGPRSGRPTFCYCG